MLFPGRRPARRCRRGASGVLNSHHRFLLSYASGVMWNVAMIATLIWLRRGHDAAAARGDPRVGIGGRQRAAVRGAAAGRAAGRAGPAASRSTRRRPHVRTIGRNFLPVFVSRGVVQVSAYIDQLIASLLGTGAVTGLQNASTLYTLPVSLFGMSVSAAELPAMSGIASGDPAPIEQRPPAARRRPAPHRLLRRPVGGRVSRARRRRSSARCFRPAASTTPTRSTSGGFSPARRSGCSRRRSAGSTRRPTTRCATRGRRCATRSSAWR